MKKFSLNVLILSLFIIFSCHISYAKEYNIKPTNNPDNIFYVSEEIRERDINNQISKAILEKESQEINIFKSRNSFSHHDNAIELNSRDNYTTEIVSTKYKTIGGFAGGQLPGGKRFPTGGGMWWADNGGPTVSGSIDFSAPYKKVNISIGLGIASYSPINGNLVNVPNTHDYFKVYVDRTMEVKHVRIYSHSNGTKKLYMEMYPSTLFSTSQYAKAV